VAKVNRSDFDKTMRQLDKLFDDLPSQAHKEFIKQTPKRSGNARAHTKLERNTIVADYPYAERLDEGYSKQNPRGMTEPTEQWIRKEISRRLKGV
jgi:hypothetical protein